jgi:hypothetical protein
VEAQIGENGEVIPQLFIDFRRFFAIPAADAYSRF